MSEAPDLAFAIAMWEKQKTHFVKMLDLQLEDLGGGKAQLRMPFGEHVLNGSGAVHGGAIMSLCDTAFWVALASLYGPSQPTATASLTCSFLRAALPPHDLVAHATVRKPGKRIVYGDDRGLSASDKLVAHATFSFLNTPAKSQTRLQPDELLRAEARGGSGRDRRRDRARAVARARSGGARRMSASDAAPPRRTPLDDGARGPRRPHGALRRLFEMPVQYAGHPQGARGRARACGPLRSLAHGAVRPARSEGVGAWADALY